ncbi:hypothetical protein GOODEAATRI_020829 [Goodea atripinnis]|uniref:Uncharacterized protein n=1 Tax=Goodea atripinnis TaxID=208336 RepID=A0ABV0N328_9TELE
MEELQVIKKELTLIKTQIDGLLDSLDRMDTQRNDHKGETPIQNDSGGTWVCDQMVENLLVHQNRFKTDSVRCVYFQIHSSLVPPGTSPNHNDSQLVLQGQRTMEM